MKLLYTLLAVLQVVSALTTPSMRHLKTSDGATLAYTQSGPKHGQNLLFVAGWRQSAAEWRKQVDHFTKAGFRVTTYDHRGHGESPEPEYGYRVPRLAADLNEVITKLDLSDVTIIGHSLGVSVIWSFWDLFAQTHSLISNLVLVDQAAQAVIDPTWSEEEAAKRGAMWTCDGVYATPAQLGASLEMVIRNMFTESVSEKDFQWVLKENRKVSDEYALAVMENGVFGDYNDVLARIDVPTFVIGGEKSIVPVAGVKWVAERIPGSKKYIFTAKEKGSHFMFWENPKKFNKLVEDFITG